MILTKMVGSLGKVYAVADSLFNVPPIGLWGFMHYLVSFLILQSS